MVYVYMGVCSLGSHKMKGSAYSILAVPTTTADTAQYTV